MSLLDEAMEGCTILDKYTVNTAYGVATKYRQGAGFDCATTLDTKSDDFPLVQQITPNGLIIWHFLDMHLRTKWEYESEYRQHSDCKAFHD